MQWKSRNVELTALLWRRMEPALTRYFKTLKSSSREARAVYNLIESIKAYRVKHMEVFDRQRNDWYNETQLLKTLPDITTLPD
jgi:hypothetical protein